MNAKQKLQGLSHSWYGYMVLTTLVSILGLRASGILTLVVGFAFWAVINAFFLLIGLALVTFVSRKLLSGSAGMRRFLVVLSALGTVLGALSVLSLGLAFLHTWSLALIIQIGVTGSWALLNARSFRTLGETQVKAYFV
jgi:hypothetical protein